MPLRCTNLTPHSVCSYTAISMPALWCGTTAALGADGTSLAHHVRMVTLLISEFVRVGHTQECGSDMAPTLPLHEGLRWRGGGLGVRRRGGAEDVTAVIDTRLATGWAITAEFQTG